MQFPKNTHGGGGGGQSPASTHEEVGGSGVQSGLDGSGHSSIG